VADFHGSGRRSEIMIESTGHPNYPGEVRKPAS